MNIKSTILFLFFLNCMLLFINKIIKNKFKKREKAAFNVQLFYICMYPVPRLWPCCSEDTTSTSTQSTECTIRMVSLVIIVYPRVECMQKILKYCSTRVLEYSCIRPYVLQYIPKILNLVRTCTSTCTMYLLQL